MSGVHSTKDSDRLDEHMAKEAKDLEKALDCATVPHRFLFNTIMVPFHVGRWLKVMAIHFFPYFFMVWDYNMKELRVMWFKMHFDSFGYFLFGFIY